MIQPSDHLPVDPQFFADRVLRCRKDKGLTQTAFVELFDGLLSQSHLSKWEQGQLKTPPRADRIAKLAEVCGWDSGELLEQTGYYVAPRNLGSVDVDHYRNETVREIARLASRLPAKKARTILSVIRDMLGE